MRVHYTEEQEALRAAVRDFARRELPPGFARECDERGRPPLDVYRRFADAGFLGIGIPEEYGGAGGDIVEITIVLEELARAMQSFASLVYRSPIHAGQGLLTYGTEEQRKRYLPGIASGRLLFCFSLSEPQAGSDAAAIRLRAERDGDSYVINGQKQFSTGAHYSDYVILATRTSDGARRHEGISLFVVDLKSPGITIEPIPTLGDRANGTNMVFYDDVRVPASNLLGEEGEGWRLLMVNLERERLSSAPISVGASAAALEQALEHARTREQFGRPIGAFQAVAHQLADVAADIYIGRLLTHDVAHRIARGERCVFEASVAKLFCTEMFNRAAYTGMQVMGGTGYTMDSDMQLHFRNARLGTIGAGSSEVMRNVIAKEIGLPRA
ncbi:acyl-CoA dehydrogenase family protein [Actinomadura sp. SCN-SB]|uniref:acyl-CoA dehydrogenase family protein n=1 Tax=Actinomadura sp. SCN-SB TaxID=3373092 RepID=UPI003753BF21